MRECEIVSGRPIERTEMQTFVPLGNANVLLYLGRISMIRKVVTLCKIGGRITFRRDHEHLVLDIHCDV